MNLEIVSYAFFLSIGAGLVLGIFYKLFFPFR